MSSSVTGSAPRDARDARGPWPTREETQAKLNRRNAAAARHRASQTYCTAERIEESAERHAGRACLIYGEERYTYAQANALINRVAHALHEEGVKRGDVVALAVENRPEFFFLWLGLSKLGATVAFLNTNVSGAPLAHALESTGARHVLIGEECLASFASIEPVAGSVWWVVPDPGMVAVAPAADVRAKRLDIHAPGLAEHNPPASWRAGTVGETPAVYIFTSGTTGLPKAAVLSHARWLITGDVMQVTMDVTPDDVFYCFLPLYHGAASLSAGATAWAAGASIVLRRKFSKREFWQDVRRHRVTICQYVGEICRYLLTEPPRENDRDHTLRTLVGAGLSLEVWDAFVKRYGELDIYEGWGSTEANTNTINLDNRIGSCGRVPFWEMTNLRVARYDVENDAHVRGPDGFLVQCAPGEVGEAIGMIIDMPDVMGGRFEGYTSREATERKILRNVFAQGDSWWSSGDLLRFDEEGYCYFVDRIGDTYRWKSENISTMEVADSLGDYPGLETIAVYGVQVPGFEGRAGMAAIVMQPGRAFDAEAFYRLTCERVPRYAAPLFIRIASVPDLTTTFKLRKVDLQREGYDAGQIADPLYVRDEKAARYVPLTPEAVARALGT
ncbi:fatty-acyl-CoA synthase [Paraburkholderia unamae]|uniref:long-chain-acyl-CoA synthetase n=1 Tax=Paraburkholderia unamae TaxID=219649 RepID=UPI000DC3073E|nr:long-chain-acyl-CoA synthetase [Paraburkholderia unamae]RAR57299.1 fatty-acyl-CoA synthase [Paraburkholderia unamae]